MYVFGIKRLELRRRAMCVPGSTCGLYTPSCCWTHQEGECASRAYLWASCSIFGGKTKTRKCRLTDSDRSGLKWSKLQKGRRFVRFFSLGFPKSIFAYLSNFGHLDFTFRKQKYVCNKSFHEYAL